MGFNAAGEYVQMSTLEEGIRMTNGGFILRVGFENQRRPWYSWIRFQDETPEDVMLVGEISEALQWAQEEENEILGARSEASSSKSDVEPRPLRPIRMVLGMILRRSQEMLRQAAAVKRQYHCSPSVIG